MYVCTYVCARHVSTQQGLEVHKATTVATAGVAAAPTATATAAMDAHVNARM